MGTDNIEIRICCDEKIIVEKYCLVSANKEQMKIRIKGRIKSIDKGISNKLEKKLTENIFDTKNTFDSFPRVDVIVKVCSNNDSQFVIDLYNEKFTELPIKVKNNNFYFDHCLIIKSQHLKQKK